MTDWRDVRSAELERQLAERDARIAELARRLAHLEELRRRSSKNSSKPPSRDGPKKTERPHLPTGKKPGGQPGHPKYERPLAPPDKVTERVVIKLSTGVTKHRIAGASAA
jgi:transposase